MFLKRLIDFQLQNFWEFIEIYINVSPASTFLKTTGLRTHQSWEFYEQAPGESGLKGMGNLVLRWGHPSQFSWRTWCPALPPVPPVPFSINGDASWESWWMQLRKWYRNKGKMEDIFLNPVIYWLGAGVNAENHSALRDVPVGIGGVVTNSWPRRQLWDPAPLQPRRRPWVHPRASWELHIF